MVSSVNNCGCSKAAGCLFTGQTVAYSWFYSNPFSLRINSGVYFILQHLHINFASFAWKRVFRPALASVRRSKFIRVEGSSCELNKLSHRTHSTFSQIPPPPPITASSIFPPMPARKEWNRSSKPSEQLSQVNDFSHGLDLHRHLHHHHFQWCRRR